MMIVVGALLGRGTDARWLIAPGLAHRGSRQLVDGSDLNLEVDPWHVIYPRMLLTAGLGLIFAPIN